MKNWRLRDANIADFGFIFRTYRDTMRDYIDQIWTWDDGTRRQHFEQSFRSDDYQIIVVDGKDVGVLSLINHDDYDFLARIEIIPAYQNQGIGQSVLTALIERAKETGHPIMLRVFKINPAYNLYKRLGFQVIRQDDVHYDMLFAHVDE